MCYKKISIFPRRKYSFNVITFLFQIIMKRDLDELWIDYIHGKKFENSFLVGDDIRIK